MRPGLVAVGAILIVLGGAGIYAAVTAPLGAGETATHRIFVGLPGLSDARAFGWGMNGSASVLVVSWQSTGPVNLTLSDPAACGPAPQNCTPGPPLGSWSRNDSGSWATSQPVHYPMLIQLRNPGPTTVHVAITLIAGRSGPPALPSLSFLTIVVADVVLAAIGALAMFLGFFLRAGVFAPRGPRGGPPPDPGLTGPRTAR